MEKPTYTVITFSPVQDFIVKSRKLRDLYGSSYILSLLSWVICQAAKKQSCSVVSPALPSVTQGMPNQIIIKGELSEDGVKEIQSTFQLAWKIIANTCRVWIEKNLNQWEYTSWKRNWDLWGNHAWEFFVAPGKPGNSISNARELMNQIKSSRDWTGINWQGESSTLSGADAIAYPGLGRIVDPRKYNYQQEQQDITNFYQQLSLKLGEVFADNEDKLLKEISNLSPEEEKEYFQKYDSSFINLREQLSIPELIKRMITYQSTIYGSSFINPREQLSIPELIKRLITHRIIIDKLSHEFENFLHNRKISEKFPVNLNRIVKDLNLSSFKDLNRHKDKAEEEKHWTGWFQGDGDGAGKYFKSLAEDEEESKTKEFSKEMRQWGEKLIKEQEDKLPGKSRMIYAGGDDFLGVLYEENKQIQPRDCFQWFYTFKSEIWHWPEEKKITPSVGFVWAGSQVPQRDVLQHCHEAEKSAKGSGRDRIAFRILFNSGNHLEWVCPWWVLDMQDLGKTSNNFPHIKVPTVAKEEKPKNLIESYQDRNYGKNWAHFYQDVALLESRHTFDFEYEKINGKTVKVYRTNIALSLIEVYFGSEWKNIIGNRKNWFNLSDENQLQTFTGILGSEKRIDPKTDEPIIPENTFNEWVINLAKVGFRLTEDKK